ncbi:MAG: ABC transporter ATP-binding protein [Planctomycetes bacterium]|nr:ABC transporter ATP-binding protein [Planctomycetota bacterium]
MNSDSSLVLEKVCKSYRLKSKSVVALKDVSLKLSRGRVLGLLGPNGAGKTTLIKLVLGLLRMDSGAMNVLGASQAGLEQKQKIGFLPEESYLYDFLTVRETVAFAAGLYRNRATSIPMIPALLKLVGMEGMENRKISQCSKGMARRTAFAQALVHDPDLLLLDEPTSGFDPIGVAELKEVILRLKHKGKSILLCSHQLADVEEICDDVLILHRGHVIASGSVSELLEGSTGMIGLEVQREILPSLVHWLQVQGTSFRQTKARGLEKLFVDRIKEWERVSGSC